jgi:hypothetical protein
MAQQCSLYSPLNELFQIEKVFFDLKCLLPWGLKAQKSLKCVLSSRLKAKKDLLFLDVNILKMPAEITMQ